MNKTEYETVQETADRLGVTVRAVQKWAAVGRIPGAQKSGRSWKIPKNAVVLESAPSVYAEGAANGIPDVYQILPFRIAMPLLNSSYPVGKCMEYIGSISDPDDRNIALAEYYFFSGRSEDATKVIEPYLDSHDPSLRFSANLICCFANLASGHTHLTRFAMRNLREQVRKGLCSDAPDKLHAIGIFVTTAASVLLHIPVPPIPPLEEYINHLPGGLKLYACYVLAHKAYLEKDYSRCLAIADMGAALAPQVFPIALIYIHIVAAMALVNMKRVDEAKKRMEAAWKLAQPDGLLEPFAEHHGLLQGMIEIYFKNDYPAEFKRIISITRAFSAGWRMIHNPEAKRDVADNLSTTEFTVAMLYSRGWSYKEIAGHLQISVKSVQRHIGNIFVKVGVHDKEQLTEFVLL